MLELGVNRKVKLPIKHTGFTAFFLGGGEDKFGDACKVIEWSDNFNWQLTETVSSSSCD